ncbi:MAG: hypothetical protein A3D31_01160 [Candidatus Fluviicola riflensis]|nr:MAG: hypothetical protein CHH17_04380 [Candidatus Fluviicola riflensis]OGS76215.1 MAG: hypothetical protein A3D31_01160 [Candidatus Fluviicola riflensis]OGS83241.1 MAG: hypothetical protein A2724_00680 [Fluviicola sp. RIFCSPHIGHO2_01_FULL_43_53]OGS83747.1 MAG: hypothetical protein A3E30_17765 [Fluviicola sp. RIFCSPHIGHO2_12_FULL_43_24]
MNNARSFLRLLTLLLVVSLHSLVAYNQNLNDDLKKVVGHLDSAASVSLSVDVKLYTKKGGELMYSTKASIDRKGKSSVTVLGDVEIFNNDDFRVDIDHEEKMMMITPKKEIIKKTKKEMQFDISDLAKWFEDEGSSSKTTLVSNTSGIRVYSITGVEGFEEVLVTLDMNQKSIKHIHYAYAKDSEYNGRFVELNYTKFKLNSVDKELNIASYFTLKSGVYTLGSRFTTYQMTSGL